MIELKKDQLIFRFLEVHEEAECRISFQRTLRIPDDNRAYSLPPGLGRFPLNLWTTTRRVWRRARSMR